jgi:hypothetical protein
MENNNQEKITDLNVNNNFGFKKPKEQKFHFYNNDYEEYTDVS